MGDMTCYSIAMEEKLVDKLFESFDQLDENELMLVLNQVGRRMLVLRCESPDSSFWYSVIMRVAKWLSTEPTVNEAEKQVLLSPPTNVSGRMRAIRSMRERSGRNLTACKDVVDKWIKDNLAMVHESVRESFLSSDKNRKEAYVS